jgi:hypothetical protein
MDDGILRSRLSTIADDSLQAFCCIMHLEGVRSKRRSDGIHGQQDNGYAGLSRRLETS